MRWAVLRGSPARRPISLNGRRGSLREKDARTRIALRRDLRPEPWGPRRLGNFRIVESYPEIWKHYAKEPGECQSANVDDSFTAERLAMRVCPSGICSKPDHVVSWASKATSPPADAHRGGPSPFPRFLAGSLEAP